MVIEMSKYLTPENASLGLKQVISDVNSGDTILFDIKAEYHFYKDFSEHKVCHMTNTDSFKNPDKLPDCASTLITSLHQIWHHFT